MWRSARNVRITYKDLGEGGVDDLVEYEKSGSLKNVPGIDKQQGPGSWNWRGKGWLKLITSHWEILGWGERPTGDGGQVERWMVTWFASTLFTEEGIDVLTDRRDGLPEETLNTILAKLTTLDEAPDVVKIVKEKLQPVEIKLPWIVKGS
jgi:hypothetical protein